jgi:hypothetical protein
VYGFLAEVALLLTLLRDPPFAGQLLTVVPAEIAAHRTAPIIRRPFTAWCIGGQHATASAEAGRMLSVSCP